MIKGELNNYYKPLFYLYIFKFINYLKNIRSRLFSRLATARQGCLFTYY